MAETDRIEKKHEKSKIRKAAQKDESAISFYLHASLFLFFLTAYAFLLFLYKNKYPLLLNNEILPEVLFSCFILLIFSFLSLLLLSFWRFLARVFIAAIAGAAIAYILGLLFPYNIGNYFVHYVPFFPQNVLMYIAENGNLIVAGISFFLFFILLNIFKGGAMAFLSLPVLVALFMLLNTASKQTIPEKIQIAGSDVETENEKTENLVYLLLADHTGYSAAMESWKALNTKDSAVPNQPLSPSFIPSFYQTNNFTFYPSAYVRYKSKHRNISNFLNPSLTEIGDDLLNHNESFYYIGAGNMQMSATRNDLFKALKEKGYRLNIYQSFPFNFCKDAGAKEFSSCITYPAPIGALYQTNLPTVSRMLLLTGHWLYSTPFGKNITQYLYTKYKDKKHISSLPFLGNPLSHSLPIGQSLVLSHLRHDILKAKGKNVFFAHLNLPHYPYVYDQNCQLKTNPVFWRSNAPYMDNKELNGEQKRWENYNQQLFCTYAQINYLIKDLEKAQLLDKTTIVIHGDKGADIQKEKDESTKLTRLETQVNLFKNNLTTVFGIYKPKNKAQPQKTACDIGTLIERHVLENTADICQPPDFASLFFNQSEQEKISAWMTSLETENIPVSSDFKQLYTNWLENGGQAYMAVLDEQLKQEDKSAGSSKISFVAPPSFMDNSAKSETKAKEKALDFVPVPEKRETDLPPPPEPLPIPETETVSVTEKQTVETIAVPDFLPVPMEQTIESDTHTTEVIADDFEKRPAPIVLPDIDASVQDKWKTTDIKEGQKTTLELLPSIAENSEPIPATLPENPIQTTDDVSAPQAAPMPQVEILELPVLEIENPLATEAKQLPETLPSATEPAPADAIEQPQNLSEEAKAIAAAEEQIKAAEEIKAKIQAAAEARAKALEEAKLKAEAEAKAQEEEEAKIQAEIEEKIKTAQEAKAKAQAAAEARAKAEEEARLKAAQEEARLKAEAEAQIKAAQEAQAKARVAERAAKAKAEEEERRKQEEAEREEMRKKTPPPPPANADQLDIIKETLIERVNDDGEVETFIYLERKPNPNKFKKKPQKERELQQQDLTRAPAEQESPTKTEAQPKEQSQNPAVVPEEPSSMPATVSTEQKPENDQQSKPQLPQIERVLED